MKKLLIIMLICLISFPANVFARCDCIGSLTLQEEVAKSKAVFVGKVKKEMYNEKWANVFDIERAWKGFALKSDTAWNEIIVDGDGCDYFFEDGKRYLVFVRRELENNNIEVTSCSMTKPVDKASRELSQLGEAEILNSQVILGEELR